MAKRMAKKKTTRPARSRKKSTARTQTRVARRKTAARAAATRTTKRAAKPKKPSTLDTAKATVKGAMANAVAAVAKRMPGATPDMDAITLLENDHRRLEDLLKQGEQTTETAVKTRRELLQTITAELGVHELIEEKLLYPALEKYPEARDIVLEGFEEHHVADLILEELHEAGVSEEQWGAKFKVFKENIEHHIEEEEREMFRTARAVFSREQLQEMGARMGAMKAAMKANAQKN